MKSELLNHLSINELSELMMLGHQSLSCSTQREFESLVLQLKKLFFFENAVCATAHVPGLFQTDHDPYIEVCDISYPPGYLELYFEKQFYFTDQVFREFKSKLSPVNWKKIDEKYHFDYAASVLALDFNMKDGWTHGIFDSESLNSTMFFLGGPSSENSIRVKTILEFIVPFFAETFKRLHGKRDIHFNRLTKREIEVLKWLLQGKNSWDISQILNCSKRTVDFHVNNIKQKLNAATRAQAVAKGLQYGILKF